MKPSLFGLVWETARQAVRSPIGLAVLLLVVVSAAVVIAVALRQRNG